MTMDNSTPGSTPPPTWTSDPAADLATPPAAAAPGQPGSLVRGDSTGRQDDREEPGVDRDRPAAGRGARRDRRRCLCRRPGHGSGRDDHGRHRGRPGHRDGCGRHRVRWRRWVRCCRPDWRRCQRQRHRRLGQCHLHPDQAGDRQHRDPQPGQQRDLSGCDHRLRCRCHARRDGRGGPGLRRRRHGPNGQWQPSAERWLRWGGPRQYQRRDDHRRQAVAA